MNSVATEQGKGADMRRFAHHILKNLPENELKKTYIAFIDGDILPQFYGSYFAAGIFLPFIKHNKTLFSKIVYARPPGYGRVNKLLTQPCFQYLKILNLYVKSLTFSPENKPLELIF